MSAAATTIDVRTALLTYARDWNNGLLYTRQGEIQKLLAARQPSKSPMWRWRTFELLVEAVVTGDKTGRDDYLDELAGGAR